MLRKSNLLTSGLKRHFTAARPTATDPKSVLAFCQANGVEFIDLKFTDLLGTQHHINLGSHMLDEGLFDGIGFDGSSIRCWQPIDQSDMLMVPMPESAVLDPFFERKTISFRCKIVDPTNNNAPYDKCPRYTLEKCQKHLKESGVADHARVGPEAEFFVFDSVRYENTWNRSFHEVDSSEGFWNAAKQEEGGNKGYKTRPKEGYFPCPPTDQLSHIRNEMAATMQEFGIPVEAMHHEVASGGQCEIDFRFDEMMKIADQVQDYKYVVRNVASHFGKTATFMPKPVYDDNGSGMHQHYSLHAADGTNLFTGDGHAGLSESAIHFIGGLIKHMPTICAFSNPITNSYRRLVPGFEAPTLCAYSGRNRSANMRIPISHPKGRRVELRTPDPACNPYITFAAVVQAGLDGVLNKIDPGAPVDFNLYEFGEAELQKHGITRVPATLHASIEALKHDNEFLKKGGVFTDDLINSYIERKEWEISELLLRPTPWEFEAYYDC